VVLEELNGGCGTGGGKNCRSRLRNQQALLELDRHPVFVFSERGMLSEALRLIRVYHDLNQTELAHKLKISKSYLSEVESGTKTPTLTLVNDYAKEFDIPASAILFFAESIDESPTSRSRAREFVSERILRVLQFVEERAKSKNAKKRRRLSS
jgi:transcriptional regulator with XRE-family HTH domain